MLINLNSKQIIAIIGVVISVLMVSSAQLTDLIGPTAAKTTVTLAGLLNMLFQGITVALTSQTSTVNDVLAMPGIEKISVNAQANQTLSQMAVDPAQDKIAPTQSAQNDVEKKAAL